MTEPVKNRLLNPNEYASAILGAIKSAAEEIPDEEQRLAFYNAFFEALGTANGFPRRG